LLALASLYQNDIDKQNIQELKSRLYRFTINQYKKFAKNSSDNIPTHYDFAVTNILTANCINADLIGIRNNNIKFTFCYRHNDDIYRVYKNLAELSKEQETLFDEPLRIFDKVKYNE